MAVSWSCHGEKSLFPAKFLHVYPPISCKRGVSEKEKIGIMYRDVELHGKPCPGSSHPQNPVSSSICNIIAVASKKSCGSKINSSGGLWVSNFLAGLAASSSSLWHNVLVVKKAAGIVVGTSSSNHSNQPHSWCGGTSSSSNSCCCGRKSNSSLVGYGLAISNFLAGGLLAASSSSCCGMMCWWSKQQLL